MSDDLTKKVNRGIAWAAGAQAIIAIADLLSQMLVIALWIPTKDVGIAFAAVPFYTMLDTAADLGVTASIISRDDHTPEKISTVFWFNMLVSSGLFVAVAILAPLYAMLQGKPILGWLLVAYGGKLIFQNVYAIPFALLRKQMRFGDIAKARVVAHLGESIGRIAFAVLGATVWCWTLAALTRAVVFGIIMQVRHPFLPRFVFRPREVVPYVKFGVRSAATQVLYQLYTNLDYPIVSHYFGDEANGLYTIAYSIILEPVKTIANVVIDVAFPTFTRLRNDRSALVKQFLAFTRLNLIAVLPFVAIVALIIPDFLTEFYRKTPAEIAAISAAVRILCLVGVLRALGFIGPPLLDGLGKPQLSLRYMVIAAVLVPLGFVVGAELLGGRLGFLAVAVAWAAAYPLAFFVLTYLVVKSIALPVGAYARAAWGIVGSVAAACAAGWGVDAALAGASPVVRMLATTGTTLAVMLTLFATWQGITPRSIRAAVRG